MVLLAQHLYSFEIFSHTILVSPVITNTLHERSTWMIANEW